MELKHVFLLLADLALIVSGYFYGWKFLRKQNYLLGLEWWIIAFSATNFFLYALTETMAFYNTSMFLDAFSRAFGFPVIATIGAMAITHGYRPTKLIDSVIFALSFAGTVVLMYVDAIAPAKPWLYLVMGFAFSLYLLYFCVRLVGVRAYGHAANLLTVIVTSSAIAVVYDFFTIPGDDADKTLFYALALTTWAYLLVGFYHAYGALERTGNP